MPYSVIPINLSIATDYYFNSAFSAGLTYKSIDNGQEHADLFTVRTKYFFQPNIAVGASAGFGDMTLLEYQGHIALMPSKFNIF